MFKQIFFGLIGLGVGLFIIIKNKSLVSFFGRMPWAERHLGPTGTYALYKFIGFLVIVLSTLFLTGDLQELIRMIAKFIYQLLGF